MNFSAILEELVQEQDKLTAAINAIAPLVNGAAPSPKVREALSRLAMHKLSEQGRQQWNLAHMPKHVGVNRGTPRGVARTDAAKARILGVLTEPLTAVEIAQRAHYASAASVSGLLAKWRKAKIVARLGGTRPFKWEAVK